MKKTVVLGILVGVAILALVATAIFNKNGIRGIIDSRTPCQKFIAAIQANDAKGSYDMFTTSIKKTQTEQKWASQVQGMSEAFGAKTALKPTGKSTSNDPNNNNPRTQENYELTYEAVTYDLTCTSTQGSGGPIAAFNSVPKDTNP